ncbi:protein PYRICULARIA ORYZAE RESISTANCE 21-like isoform X1 [Miscanthus floridulus]|uniref:protein PYRICULARIA ORYZAE RESISTANCE 21-like isoform X1 n=2 Tax=Miscanthus floridulus TaxID=154761 RepID=UPI0034587BED
MAGDVLMLCYFLFGNSPMLFVSHVCLQMGILVITVDLECCRCRDKITKVLDSLKEEFCIEKVEFEDKKEKKVVVVRGKFDPEKLCKKVWCKAGKVVKEIIIVDVWPIPPPPKPDKCCCCEHCKPKPDKCCCCEHCKPKPDKCCDCDHCKPKPKPTEEAKPKPKPPPAKIQYKVVPYPYPLPNTGMCQSWPWQCPPQQQCQCCEKPQPPPPPPCSCSSHASCGCGQTPPVWPVWPPQPPVWPPPWAGSNVVADENSCSVM